MHRSGQLFVALMAAFCLLSRSSVALACATCAAGDATVDASGSERPFESRKRVSLDLRATRSRVAHIDVFEERAEVRADFALSSSLLVTAALPAIARSIRNRNGAASREIRFGDAELRASSIASDTGVAKTRRMWIVFGGSKFPTAPLQTDAQGAPLPVALQPGCGSIVPILGASLVTIRAPLTLVASASFYLPFSVREGPHAGDSWRASLTLQFQPARSKVGTRFGLSTRFDQAGALGNERVDPNSGGFVGSASAEILVMPWTDVVVSAGLFSPAVQVLRGNQRESTIVLATVSYDF